MGGAAAVGAMMMTSGEAFAQAQTVEATVTLIEQKARKLATHDASKALEAIDAAVYAPSTEFAQRFLKERGFDTPTKGPLQDAQDAKQRDLENLTPLQKTQSQTTTHLLNNVRAYANTIKDLRGATPSEAQKQDLDDYYFDRISTLATRMKENEGALSKVAHFYTSRSPRMKEILDERTGLVDQVATHAYTLDPIKLFLKK